MAERIPKIILFILLVFVANASYSQIDEVRVIDNKGTIKNVDGSVTNEIQDLSLSGNTLTITNNTGATDIDLAPYLDNTDNQQITNFSIDGSNVLTLTLEEGGTKTVDLSGYVNTDDQGLTLDAGTNILTLEDGGTVDLSPYLDNTDDQIISASLDNTTKILTISLVDGGTQTVDFTTVLAAAGTDDQALTLETGNILTLEDGGTVDLTPFLDNTDDQAISASLDNTTKILTISLEDGGTQTVDFTTVLAAAGTDDQALTLETGNILTLEDGGTVDLTPFLDNTDDQAISASLDNTTKILTISLEDGGTQTVDFTTVLAAAGTDDQALTLEIGNILTLEDGGTVDLTPFLDNTDAQTIALAGNTITLANGTGSDTTVDLSVFALDSDVAGVQADVDQNKLDIATNAANITSNESDISSFQTEQLNQNGFITANASEITTNTTAIGVNSTAIASNDSDISSLQTEQSTQNTFITANASAITTNSTGIGTNTSDISTNATNISNHITADGDLSATNEIQTLSISGSDLTISSGNTVTLPSGSGPETDPIVGAVTGLVKADGSGTISAAVAGTDYLVTEVDGSITNEIQTLLQTGTDVTLSAGGGTISVVDNDNDSTNELNTAVSSTDNSLTVTDSGGSFSADIINTNLLVWNRGEYTSIVNGVPSDPVLLISNDFGNRIVAGSDDGLFLNYFIQRSSNVGNIISISGDGTSGDPFEFFASETVTTYTDATVGTKHKIGEYTNETPTAVAINETVTKFEQETTTPTGVITYTDEAGGTSTAKVVSTVTTNPDHVVLQTGVANNNPNSISVGSDGGAYFASPLTRAIISIDSGNGNLVLDGTHSTIIIKKKRAIVLPTGDEYLGKIYIIKNTLEGGGGKLTISTYKGDKDNNKMEVKEKYTLWLQYDGVDWQQISKE